MKTFHSLLLITFILLISACSPHPVSGVWKTTENNDYGITKLIVSFGGKAEFITPKLDNATWHCFWGATEKQQANLDCTPSTNPDDEQKFTITINAQGFAELTHNSKLIATLTQQNENPIIE